MKRTISVGATEVLLYKYCYKLNASSAGPDQTPRSVAFDLSLHCLSIFFS